MTMIFVVENNCTIVSRSHGCFPAASLVPAQRSTTIRPWCVMASDAPASSSSSKLATKASASGRNLSSQNP